MELGNYKSPSANPTLYFPSGVGLSNKKKRVCVFEMLSAAHKNRGAGDAESEIEVWWCDGIVVVSNQPERAGIVSTCPNKGKGSLAGR